MHIPDGYLSPSTCAVLYGGAGAGWYVSLRRMKRNLNVRMVPLISVFAAFSFVVMLFNLPLPGGTTGHALGVTIAAIVLGPAGAILATSLAVAIQALFFGDGGITTLGANCFNMAVVGSLVAYVVYRAISANAALASRRRVVAAAVAGYVAVNAAALLTAIQFGVQPLLFRDAQGVPLYAPYSLGVAVPAMMIGHLLIAGVAEAAISAGLVAYLQAADPALLRATSGLVHEASPMQPAPAGSLRRLWITVAFLMFLTPVGILAAGTAWGEWSASRFATAEGRARIAASSNYQPVPDKMPAGIERLATVWTAPIPAYAPAFIKSPHFGYFLSAAFGVGLLILLSFAAQAYVQRARPAGSGE